MMENKTTGSRTAILNEIHEVDEGLNESEKKLIDKNNSVNESLCINDADGRNNTMLAYFNRGFDNTFVTLDETGISNCNASILEDLVAVKNDSKCRKRRYSNESAIIINSSEEGSDEDEAGVKKNAGITPILLISNKKKKMPSYCTPVKRKMFNTLLTASEHKKNQLYGKNLYNPNVSTIAEEDENLSSLKANNTTNTNLRKRVIVIDGSNIGYHHGLHKQLSVRGIEICIRYFEKMGHPVKVILPQYRLQYGKSSNPKRLNELYLQGKLFFTPCKNFGYGRSFISYDDRYILQIAVEFDGAVISNDNYRDLITENIAFKKIIENRVIGFTWCHDLFILPKDPYGANGPSLEQILNI